MKKLPYGITDYKSLIEKDYYYVDKTKYLETLESTKEVLLYLRPRRFGKTLFTSMMSYYYDINSKDLFDSLFKDTYIYNNPTPNKNNYYIFKLDFSGIGKNDATEDEISKLFVSEVRRRIENFVSTYNLTININLEENNPASLISDFFNAIDMLKLKNKIYVIIDEYDNFTNSILGANVYLFKDILGDTGFVKNFYAELKKAKGTVIDRIFITGVCSISLDSMTSGFNIATNITNDERFDTMTALTYDEVETIINGLNVDNKEEIFSTLVENYDGYKFGEDVDYKVFNTTLVLYYLSNIYETGKAPDELLDINIVSNNFKTALSLINIASDITRDKLLDELYDEIITSNLEVNFDINETINRSHVISLLYYFGYLTIESPGAFGIKFKIPNNVMYKVYTDMFIKSLENKAAIDSKILEEIIIEVAETGTLNKISEYVKEVLGKIYNRDYERFDEKYVKLLYFSYLSESNLFKTYTEFPANGGYADLVIFKTEKSNYNIMVEFKYVKKSDSSLVYDAKLKEAEEELERYSKDERVPKDIKKYIVIFKKDKYEIIEK